MDQLVQCTVPMFAVDGRMNRISPAATEAASRLWNDRVGNTHPPAITANATVHLLGTLRLGLGRWIGVSGYDTLLDRAVGITREEHPWISLLFQPEVQPADLLAAVESFGTPVVSAGTRQLLAVLIELLGRIVSIEMAVHLVTRIGLSDKAPAISPATEGGNT